MALSWICFSVIHFYLCSFSPSMFCHLRLPALTPGPVFCISMFDFVLYFVYSELVLGFLTLACFSLANLPWSNKSFELHYLCLLRLRLAPAPVSATLDSLIQSKRVAQLDLLTDPAWEILDLQMLAIRYVGKFEWRSSSVHLSGDAVECWVPDLKWVFWLHMNRWAGSGQH